MKESWDLQRFEALNLVGLRISVLKLPVYIIVWRVSGTVWNLFYRCWLLDLRFLESNSVTALWKTDWRLISLQSLTNDAALEAFCRHHSVCSPPIYDVVGFIVLNIISYFFSYCSSGSSYNFLWIISCDYLSFSACFFLGLSYSAKV